MGKSTSLNLWNTKGFTLLKVQDCFYHLTLSGVIFSLRNCNDIMKRTTFSGCFVDKLMHSHCCHQMKFRKGWNIFDPPCQMKQPHSSNTSIRPMSQEHYATVVTTELHIQMESSHQYDLEVPHPFSHQGSGTCTRCMSHFLGGSGTCTR